MKATNLERSIIAGIGIPQVTTHVITSIRVQTHRHLATTRHIQKNGVMFYRWFSARSKIDNGPSGTSDFLPHPTRPPLTGSSLNEQSSGPMWGIMGGGNGSNHVVSRERGTSRGDVVVDDTVGIEMKRHFSNSQKKKLRGQLEDYADNYPYVIALACGIDDMDGWRELENKLTQNRGIGMNQTEFTFIVKRRENFGEPHDFGNSGGLGDIPGL